MEIYSLIRANNYILQPKVLILVVAACTVSLILTLNYKSSGRLVVKGFSMYIMHTVRWEEGTIFMKLSVLGFNFPVGNSSV